MKISTNILVIDVSNCHQRRSQNPVKHLRLSFFRKQLTLKAIFAKSLWIFDRILNKPLYNYPFQNKIWIIFFPILKISTILSTDQLTNRKTNPVHFLLLKLFDFKKPISQTFRIYVDVTEKLLQHFHLDCYLRNFALLAGL